MRGVRAKGGAARRARISSPAILASVGVAGACLFVLEVVGARMLTTYYGNTIYLFSGVTSSILAAMALGYWLGGRWARKSASPGRFYALVTAGGLSVPALYVAASFFLPAWGYRLSPAVGPLVGATVFLAPSSALIAALSPVAIQALSTSRGAATGAVAARVFFWSTAGNIIGCLAAAFLLIPFWAISRILPGIGLVLTSVGVLGLCRDPNTAVGGLLALLLAAAAAGLKRDYYPLPPNTLYSRDGPFSRITISDDRDDRPLLRKLQAGRDFASYKLMPPDRMRYLLQHPVYGFINFPYLKDIETLLCRSRNFHPRKILVVGGGAYVVPNRLLRAFPDARVDIAEVDPLLPDLAARYFDFAPSKRVRNFTEDGRSRLRYGKDRYDLVFVDAGEESGYPPQLATKEFYRLVRARLRSGGMLIVNSIGIIPSQGPSLTSSLIKTLRAVFPESRYYALGGPAEKGLQNIELAAFVDSSVPTFGQGALARMEVHLGRHDLDSSPLLTDSYSPVEYLMSRAR